MSNFDFERELDILLNKILAHAIDEELMNIKKSGKMIRDDFQLSHFGRVDLNKIILEMLHSVMLKDFIMGIQPTPDEVKTITKIMIFTYCRAYQQRGQEEHIR